MNEKIKIPSNLLNNTPFTAAFVFVVLSLVACSWHDNDTDDNRKYSNKASTVNNTSMNSPTMAGRTDNNRPNATDYSVINSDMTTQAQATTEAAKGSTKP